MNDIGKRKALIEAALKMNAEGINQGISGNVSVRTGEGFLITPSGIPYGDLQPADPVYMGPDGTWESPLQPSSEWRFHADIYACRRDAMAIVHTHSVYATALACLDRGIPAFHYSVATAGGHDIRCAPYATYGTQELSDRAIEALTGRRACLLAHHGVIAIGKNLHRALALAAEVETLAHQYLAALAVGEPTTLARSEMDTVVEKFKTYGLEAQSSAND